MIKYFRYLLYGVISIMKYIKDKNNATIITLWSCYIAFFYSVPMSFSTFLLAQLKPICHLSPLPISIRIRWCYFCFNKAALGSYLSGVQKLYYIHIYLWYMGHIFLPITALTIFSSKGKFSLKTCWILKNCQSKNRCNKFHK